MHISPGEVYDLIIYQVSALAGFARINGTRLHHVKPHGALYNMAAKDEIYARAIADAIADFDSSLVLYALSGSELIRAGNKRGLVTCSEVFADRRYQDDGNLTPRTKPHALITKTNDAVEQVIRMVKEKTVISENGKPVNLIAETICIHGDGEHAIAFAKEIRTSLEKKELPLKHLTAHEKIGPFRNYRRCIPDGHFCHRSGIFNPDRQYLQISWPQVLDL
jgi:UPF0271 protein